MRLVIATLLALSVSPKTSAADVLPACDRTAFARVSSADVEDIKFSFMLRSSLPYNVAEVSKLNGVSILRISYDHIAGDYSEPYNPAFVENVRDSLSYKWKTVAVIVWSEMVSKDCRASYLGVTN